MIKKMSGVSSRTKNILALAKAAFFAEANGMLINLRYSNSIFFETNLEQQA